MSIFESIILGIVQGLTEFLPVSSSGHLVLLQKVFGVSEAPIFFSAMLHVGTLIAVVVVLWQEIVSVFRRPLKKFWLLVIATIPAGIAGLLLNDFFESLFGGQFLALGFLITALLIIACEMTAMFIKKKKDLPSYPNAVVMGVMQAVAIVPGISRSGSTLAGALFCGVSRDSAAKFAFLMSIPVILASTLLEGYKVVQDSTGISEILVPTIVGTVFAAVSGYLAVRFMLNLIKKHRMYGFAIYTAILGIVIMIDQFALHYVF